MVSTEEILITMLAQDKASDVFEQVANNAQSSLSGVSGGASDVSGSFNQLGTSGGSTFDGLRQGVQALNTGIMGLSSATGMLFNELGAQKSASDYVYGTSSAEDTNKVLLARMRDTVEQGESMYNTIDKVTDGSLVSMQDLIPSLNVIQSATGATGQELEDVTSKVANFGSFVMAQEGSVELTRTAMDALAKAIKGSYQIVDDYGITEDALLNTGKWDGDEKDLQGFMEAVEEVVGPMDDMMNTSEGLDAQMGKMWSRAGKQIGRELLPYTKSLKGSFLELDQSMGGQLSKNLLLVQFGIETVQGKLYEFSAFMEAFDDINNGWKVMRELIGGVGKSATDSAQAVSNLAEATNNVSQMGATASEVGQMTGAVPYSNLGNDEIGQVASQMALDSIPMKNPQAEHEASVQEKASNRLRVNREYSQPSSENFVKGNTATGERVSNLLKQTEDLNQETQLTGQLLNATKEYENLSETYSDFVQNGLRNVDIDIPEDEFLSSMGKELEKKKERIKELTKAQEDVNLLARLGGSGHNIPQDLISKNTGSIVEEAISEVEESTTLTGLLRGKIDGFGGSFQNALQKGFGGLGDGIRRIGNVSASDIKQGVTSFGKSIKDISVDNLKAPIDKLTSGLKKVNLTNLKSALGNLNTNLGESISNFSFSDIGGKLKGAFKGADAIEEVVEDVEKVGTAGEVLATTAPAMEAGAVGAEATAVAETTLSGAFMSMLVPTLAIAGVIAIMIPVVAGLVVEALFFVNLIGQVITAMNFDSINVDGVAEKLQALAMAMAWIGVAMASMSFAGLMTGIAFLTTGFGQVQAVLGQAVSMLKTATTELNNLGDERVDESVVINLQNLGNALNGVSSAMMSLTGVTLSTFIGNIVTFGGLFGNLSSNLTSAKKDLQQAINTINSLEFGNIDEAKVQQISTVMQAIGNFGSAFDGLLKIRDGAKWSDITNMLLDGIFGTSTETVQQAFEKAHNDIRMASQSLQYYNDLETVDEQTAGKIKTVTDSIVAIADALEALSKLKEDKGFLGAIDSFLNGGNDNLLSGLDTANTIVREASSKIAGLKDMAEIDASVGEKIKNLNDTLKVVIESIDAMGKIKTADKDMDLSTIPQIIEEASGGIRAVATQLSNLKDMTEIDPSVTEKLTKVSNTLGDVNNALNGINTINQTTGGWDFKGLDGKFSSIGSTLGNFAKEMSSLGKTLSDEAHTIPEDLSSKLATIGDATGNLVKAVVPLNNMPQVNGQNIGFKVARAVTGVKRASGVLKSISSADNVDTGVSTIIKNVGSAFKTLKNTALKMNSFPQVDGHNIGYKVGRAVTGVKRASTEMRKLTEGDKVGNIGDTLKSVRTGVSQLKKTINAMNFKPQGKNIGKNIKLGIKSGMSGLSSTVSSKVKSASSSANSSGKDLGRGIGTTVVDGVKFKLKLADIFKQEMGYIKQSLDNHGELVSSARAMAEAVVQGAKDGSQVKSPGAIAHMWEDEMGYSSMLMERGSTGLIRTARNVASNVVSSFNNSSTLTPKLMNFDTIKSDLNKAQIGTMMELRKPSNMGKKQRPVHITVGEGAVKLDARNMTMKESRQIMINALEGLDMVNGVDIKDNV